MSIEELNQLVSTGDIDEFVRVCEARQRKRLSKIADDIASRKDVRLVLLAGASSAGKTTTAKRLCTQLRVNDLQVMLCSTDDYFVGDARNPRGPDGEPDYETVEAVDHKRMSQDVKGLLEGRKVRLRKFDFLRHDGYDSRTSTQLPSGGILMIEGIHALNPILIDSIPEDCKYRVYVEPTTQPEIIGPQRLSVPNARLLRRLVRDNQFRKLDPFDTFHIWPKVIAGEEKWIAPYRPLANAEFDSALAYELCVLKPYVQGLLERVRHRDSSNALAGLLAGVMSAVLPISPYVVPGDSIIRETIGSSQLEY